MKDTETTEIYTLGLHDALPISAGIHEGKVDAVPLQYRPYAVASDARTIIGNRPTGPNEAVEERRLAYVGATYDSDNGPQRLPGKYSLRLFAHPFPLPVVNPISDSCLPFPATAARGSAK